MMSNLIERNMSKYSSLTALSDHYKVPFIEFDEERAVDKDLLRFIDLEKLKQALWFPIARDGDSAHVMMHDPGDSRLCEDIREKLGVRHLTCSVAIPQDIIRTIEHQQDINPGFPVSSARTPLARLRTWLAGLRTSQAQYRTILAEGRTGLSIIRTGISFLSIGLVFFRIFGLGYLSIVEAALVILGLAMTVEGLMWYIPVRRSGQKSPDYNVTEPTFGTTVLEISCEDDQQNYSRTPPVEGAEKLRSGWNRLTPVMKRRFLAIDRTDLADERTILANYRTLMAHTRTGLAFTRTGNAFIGLGIGLLRYFKAGPWTILDGCLILAGLTISIEGLHWYVPGWNAGRASFHAVRKHSRRKSLWDQIFHPFGNKGLSPDDLPPTLSLKGSYVPGIWGTTGLALERTIIAERRNVKSRLRTIMARSRTGMAFIRTGASIFSVGMGLLLYFGTANHYWTAFNLFLVAFSFIFIIDGLYWHLPAEKIRKRFPYCYGQLEFSIPDYSKPKKTWNTIVLENDYV